MILLSSSLSLFFTPCNFSLSVYLFSLCVCDCERGVSLSGSPGEEPTGVFFLFPFERKIIRSEVVLLTCCTLVASEFTSRLQPQRTEAETLAALGRVMSDEALRVSKRATVARVGACLMKSASRGSINRDYNKRGREHSGMRVVSGDWYRRRRR